MMNNFENGTYKIISTNAGFSKVERPDGILHNLSEATIRVLKNKKGIVFTKVEIVEMPILIKSADKGSKPLDKMNKSELGEIAIRYNFDGDLTDPAITKAIMVKFIEDEQAKG